MKWIDKGLLNVGSRVFAEGEEIPEGVLSKEQIEVLSKSKQIEIGGRKEPKTVAVKGIAIVDKKAKLKVGETYQIEAVIKPENATNKNITYLSSDLEVASVDDNGLVTSKAEGVSIITAKTGEGDFEAMIEVTVK